VVAVSVVTLILLVFGDGFDGQFHGYRAWLSCRTHNSIKTLMSKPLLRMVAAYFLIGMVIPSNRPLPSERGEQMPPTISLGTKRHGLGSLQKSLADE